jgi:hypothetical protein
MKRPFDVADRAFDTNLGTLRGWHDFWVVMRDKFVWLRNAAFVALAGFLLPLPRRWLLPFWSLFLFIIWYAVMFNSIRWATTAVLLTTSAAFLVCAFVVDRLLDVWDGRGQALLSHLAGSLRREILGPGARMAASLALVLILAFMGIRIARHHGQYFLPSWMDETLLTALTRSGDPEKYLDATRPDYELYRYIGRHQLSQVLQPYDNGATFYASAYNDGQPNRWILHYRTMPARIADTGAFLARNHVRYFIQPSALNAVEVERLGPDHVALANRMIAELKPHSRLLIADSFGNRLYEILPEARR